MWIISTYEPVAAFGLRPSNTTSSGGKSLICPTPYALKMALLDRMIRCEGFDYGVERFPLVRDMRVQVQVPDRVVVNRTFQKVLRPSGKLWTQTIAQREICFFGGLWRFAFEVSDPAFADALPTILSWVNYFGRRGSFVQFAGAELQPDPPKTGFVDLSATPRNVAPGFGFLQRMDDMRPDATFEDVSVYVPQRASSDGGRVSYNVVFPYRLEHHGFNHTVYARQETAS